MRATWARMAAGVSVQSVATVTSALPHPARSTRRTADLRTAADYPGRWSWMTRLVTHGRDQRQDAARFCTHCGVVTDDAPQRVCESCGMGVVLSCARDAAPAPDAPFLIVTTDLRVT